MPNRNDSDGLSVSQVGISSIEVASTTSKGKRECLAEFPTSAAIRRGLTVKSKPTEHDPGHAVIPEMSFTALASPETEAIVEEHALALARASIIAWPPNGEPPPQG